MQAGLTKAYELVRCKVSPGQLLLDPTNPRLITNWAQDRDYGAKEIGSEDVQAYVLDLVWKARSKRSGAYGSRSTRRFGRSPAKAREKRRRSSLGCRSRGLSDERMQLIEPLQASSKNDHATVHVGTEHVIQTCGLDAVAGDSLAEQRE